MVATILNRIFPNDIARYIYNIYFNHYIETILLPKLYTLDLIIDKLLFDYKRINHPNNSYYIIGINLKSFQYIDKTFDLIKKYNYKVTNQLSNKITNLKFLIRKLINQSNKNNQEKIYHKLLIKLLSY